MYRWLRKKNVEDIGRKTDRALSTDLLDNKLDILDRMYMIAMDKLVDEKGNKIEVPVKIQAETGKSWLDAIKQDKTINLNLGDNQTINIVQIVQDKLSAITSGSTIRPDGIIEHKPKQELLMDKFDTIMSKAK